MAPGGNIGDDKAMFEAVHGSAPDIAGQGVANPTAMFLAAAMMLDHLDLDVEARRVRNAIIATLRAGDRLTPDLCGNGGTEDFADAVIGRV